MGGGIGGIGDAQSTPAGSPRRRRRSLSCEKVATATAAKWRAKAAIAALAFEREWGPLGEGKRREEGSLREREGGREGERGTRRGGGREEGREGGREGGRELGRAAIWANELGILKFMDSALQKPLQRHPRLFGLNYPTESSQGTPHYCWSTGPIQ